MTESNAGRRRTKEAAATAIREDGQDYVDTAKAMKGAVKGQVVRSDPPSAPQEDAQDLRAVVQTTQAESAVESEVEGENVPNTLERAGEAQQVRKPGWRHIGRVPGTPGPVPTESDPSSRRAPQLPTEVWERVIDFFTGHLGTLRDCALVCKEWTPRCRYWRQRHVYLLNRSQVQGHARRARAQPHILQQARTVWVRGGESQGEQAPTIPHLGTFAMMWAAKLPLVRCLGIQIAIWKPSDLHPLIFVHLSAFSSLTTLRLFDVTFPKVHEFGRLVCALQSLVRLRCDNVLFTSTAPCASLAITRCPPSVRLTHLVIFSRTETAANVESNRALVEHLCAAGVVADLQEFEFFVGASSDSKYLDTYREPIHELLQQSSRSLCYLTLSPILDLGKDLETDAVSNTIASVFDLACCSNLKTVVLNAWNFEEVGYAWMRRILESSVSKNLREVSIVMSRAENLQRTVSALRKDMCPQLNELFSNKDYEKLHHVDFVFSAHPSQVIPDVTQWASLLKAEMPKLDERGVLRTRVDVFLELWIEDSL